MPDTPTTLDLDAIRAAVADLDAAFAAPDNGRTLVTEHPTLTLLAHVAAQVPAILAEVERLRAEVRLAKESARSAGLALGARLTARPAPAWDEDAAALAVFERSHEPPFEDSEEGMQEAKRFVRSLAVVREHLPVKPDREAVARAIFEAGAAGAAVEFGLDGPVPWSSLDADDVERMCAQADAALDLWPGESRATVQAEALRAFADTRGVNVGDEDDEWWRGYRQAQRECLHDASARADHLAAEGGADRG